MIPSSHLSKTYRGPWGTITDLYQLTMAYGYWKEGLHEQRAVFHLFYRKPPYGGSHAVSAGLALAADFLRNYRFSTAEVQYLGSLRGADNQPLFSKGFLYYLRRLRFTGDLYAMPEGTPVLPHQPILRIEAPLAQAQLIETGLLNLVNFSTLIATKASRISREAAGQDVLEFGLRRAQGLDGGLTASRSAYIGGCTATSNVWAGQQLGIPVKGTHAHSWVMLFGDEMEAFHSYADALPANCVFLVDTYDTIDGVLHAISVGHELRAKGFDLLGIRLDSGDLAKLSRQARALLDNAGFHNTRIIASNDLDEHKLAQLREEGALIDVWGVGTQLVTGGQQAALGGVYKLAALETKAGEWDYRIKLSEDPIKVSNPGRLQVRRYLDENGRPVGDLLYDIDHPPEELLQLSRYQAAGSTNLLQAIIRDGRLVYDFPTLSDIRDYCQQQVVNFSQPADKPYLCQLEPQLQEMKDRLLSVYQPSGV